MLLGYYFFDLLANPTVDACEHRHKVIVVYEKPLLGACGILIQTCDFWINNIAFVIHADNFCNDSQEGLISAYNNRPTYRDASLLLLETPTLQQCVFAEIIGKIVITAFHKKVSNPRAS